MHPAGSLKPNELGLFDVLGNALEWCGDAWDSNFTAPGYGTLNVDALVGVGYSDDYPRILRGGSFYSSATVERSADRGGNQPTDRYTHFGFRLARTHP